VFRLTAATRNTGPAVVRLPCNSFLSNAAVGDRPGRGAALLPLGRLVVADSDHRYRRVTTHPIPAGQRVTAGLETVQDLLRGPRRPLPDRAESLPVLHAPDCASRKDDRVMIGPSACGNRMRSMRCDRVPPRSPGYWWA
jgi:hypothetical protein